MRRPAALLGIATLMVLWTLSACGADGAKKPVAGSHPARPAETHAASQAGSYAAQPVGQIESDAVAAMTKVGSLHMKGRLTVADEGTFTFDVSLTRSGDCSGHLDIVGQGGADFRLVDGVPYMRWSKALGDHLAAGSGVDAQVIAGHWIDMRSQENVIGPFCDLDKILTGFTDDPAQDDDEVIGASTYRGTSTVKLRSRGNGGEMDTAQVSAASPHYVLRMDSDKGQVVEFSEFGKPVTVKEPAKILDLSSLGG